MKKMALLALGLVIVCVQSDPIAQAQSNGRKIDTMVQSTMEDVIPQIEKKQAIEAKERAKNEKTDKDNAKKAEAIKKAQVQANQMASEMAVIDSIQKAREEELAKDATGSYYNGIRLFSTNTYEHAGNYLTRSNGVVHYNGHKETWYSIHEPGQTSTAVRIPGKHVAKDGTIRDEEGYICVAANQGFMRIYSTLMTTLGPAKVYDTGCSYGTIDIYTTW